MKTNLEIQKELKKWTSAFPNMTPEQALASAGGSTLVTNLQREKAELERKLKEWNDNFGEEKPIALKAELENLRKGEVMSAEKLKKMEGEINEIIKNKVDSMEDSEETETLKHNLKLLERECHDLSNERTYLQSVKSNLETKYNELKRSFEDVNINKEELNKKVKELNNLITGYEIKYQEMADTLGAAIEQKRRELGILEEENETVGEVIFRTEVVERGISELQEETKRLKKVNLNLEKEFKELAQAFKEKDVTSEEYDAKLKETERLLLRQKSEFEKKFEIQESKWKEFYDDQMKLNGEYSNKIKEKERLIEELKKRLENEKDISEQEKKRLEDEIEKGVTEIESLKGEISSLGTDIIKLENSLRDKETELDTIRESKEVLLVKREKNKKKWHEVKKLISDLSKWILNEELANNSKLHRKRIKEIVEALGKEDRSMGIPLLDFVCSYRSSPVHYIDEWGLSVLQKYNNVHEDPILQSYPYIEYKKHYRELRFFLAHHGEGLPGFIILFSFNVLKMNKNNNSLIRLNYYRNYQSIYSIEILPATFFEESGSFRNRQNQFEEFWKGITYLNFVIREVNVFSQGTKYSQRILPQPKCLYYSLDRYENDFLISLDMLSSYKKAYEGYSTYFKLPKQLSWSSCLGHSMSKTPIYESSFERERFNKENIITHLTIRN
jgi:hypothetical protein